jgi:hypothetical protein
MSAQGVAWLGAGQHGGILPEDQEDCSGEPASLASDSFTLTLVFKLTHRNNRAKNGRKLG